MKIARKISAALVVVLLLVFVSVASLSAQSNSASVTGTVTDPSGKPVQDAAVAVRNEASAAVSKGTTDAQGKYSVGSLPAGTYTIEVSAPAFALASHPGITLGAGGTQDVPVSLVLGSVSDAITVEANTTASVAAQLAPQDSLLEAATPRTEIKPTFVTNFTSPIADFGELVQMAPGTFSISTNGVGLAQDKTYFRGFPDGDYDIDFDGVPFYDTNTPTHHTWVFFPDPWVGSVDFDRSPGTASTIGPTPFGGSIHLLSPAMLSTPLIQFSTSYGTWNTLFLDGHFDSGPFTGGKSNLSADWQHMTSNGYQTNNFQTRNAGDLKYVYKFSDGNYLTAYSGIVYLDSNTSNNNPTRAQLAAFGDNYLSTNTCTSVATCSDPLYYKFYTYHVPTDVEYVDWSKQFGRGWQLDFKPYTLSYYNAQYYENPSYLTTGPNAGVQFATTNPAAQITQVSAVDKLNSYRKFGDTLTVEQVSKYGILRTGLWYEWAYTNRYQIPSNPQTHVDATLGNFHENFWSTSAQPFVEYEYHATHKLTVTAGFKYAYFSQSLKQYQDNGKTVGCLGGTLVGAPKTTAAVSCNGGAPFTDHSAGYNSYLPSLDANYRLMSNWSVYGQYGTGTIVPPSGVFDVTGASVLLTPKPTAATTFQGGSVVKLKYLTLNGDYYHTKFQNTYVAIPDPNNSTATDYTSAGDSVSQGFEGEANVALTRGFSFYVNGTTGSAKYISDNLPSKGLWVANTPADTEAVGLSYQQKSFAIGMFDKRVGNMWNDSTAAFVVPANGSLTVTNPDGNAFTYTNATAANSSVKLTTNQTIPIGEFNTANLYFNFTLHRNSRFDGTKFRIAVNNLFNAHNIVGVSAGNPLALTAPAATVRPWAFAPSGADQITLMSSRSITGSITFAFNPKGL